MAWYEIHKEIAALQFPKCVESLILRMKVRRFKRTGICIRNGQKSINIVMWLRLEFDFGEIHKVIHYGIDCKTGGTVDFKFAGYVASVCHDSMD